MFKTNIVKYSRSFVGAKVYTQVTNGAEIAKACNHFKYMVKPQGPAACRYIPAYLAIERSIW